MALPYDSGFHGKGEEKPPAYETHGLAPKHNPCLLDVEVCHNSLGDRPQHVRHHRASLMISFGMQWQNGRARVMFRVLAIRAHGS